MLIYNFNLLIVYVCSLISRISKNKVSTKVISYIFTSISFLSMFIVSGYRYKVGTDYNSYRHMFINIENDMETFEIGYYILNKIVYKINSNPQTIFIVTSFIIVFLFFITIFKYCKRYELGLYLFITMFHFYTSFNVIRQYIAIGITFYAVRYIFKKKFYNYLIAILLATTFHSTAIIMIPIYFIVNMKLDTKEYFWGTVIGLISLVSLDKLLNLLIKLVPKYENYTNSEFFTYGSSSGIIIYGFIFMIMYRYRKELIKLDKRNYVYINFTFIAVLISILTTQGVLFSRLAGFFNIYSVILIPNLLDILSKKEKRLVYYLILCSGYLYCYLMLRSNQGEVLPFKFMQIIGG